MSRPPIAVQLYTLRDLTAQDMAGTLAKVAELGYEGVEFAGYGNLDILEAHRAVTGAGLKVVGNHTGFDALRNDFNKVIDDNLLLNNKYIVCPSLPGEQRSKEGYAAFGKEMNELGARVNSAGMTLCYHNHDFEFEKFDGEYGLDLLYANSQPQLVQAELDTYWVKKGGADPVAYIRQYSGRVPLLHIKDMNAEQGFAEVGNGSLDWPNIFAAAEDGGVTAYIVEQDVCPGDPIDSIRQSIEFLKSMGKLS